MKIEKQLDRTTYSFELDRSNFVVMTGSINDEAVLIFKTLEGDFVDLYLSKEMLSTLSKRIEKDNG